MKKLQTHNGLVVKSSSSNHVALSGYASVFNYVDSHNDIVMKGAFATSDPNYNVKFLWQHDQTKPIGVVTKLHEDSYGLYAEATINGSTQQGQEAIALVRQGALDGLSIGFYVKEASYNSLGQREITALDLLEISLVTFPANQAAQVSLIKSDDYNRFSAAIERAYEALATMTQYYFNQRQTN